MTQRLQLQQEMSRYTRSEMLRLKDSKFGRMRPKHLSGKFNNKEGLFSPDLWIEGIWAKEGVVDRSDSLLKRKAKHEEQHPSDKREMNGHVPLTRRTISNAGCKESLEGSDKQEKPHSIRNRHLSNSAAGSAMDFRPAFQKNSSSPSIRVRFPTTFARTQEQKLPSTKRVGLEKQGYEEEAAPEWLDCEPASMEEPLELKGFDEGEEENHFEADNMSSSGELVLPKQDAHEEADSKKGMPSEDELAKCFGLVHMLDGADSEEHVQGTPSMGSRFRRFFQTEHNTHNDRSVSAAETVDGAAKNKEMRCSEVQEMKSLSTGLPQLASSKPTPASNQSPTSLQPIEPSLVETGAHGTPPYGYSPYATSQYSNGGHSPVLQSQLSQATFPMLQSTQQPNLGAAMHPATATIAPSASGHYVPPAQYQSTIQAIQHQLQQYEHLPQFQAFMRQYEEVYKGTMQQQNSMVDVQKAQIYFMLSALQQWQRYIEQLKAQQSQMYIPTGHHSSTPQQDNTAHVPHYEQRANQQLYAGQPHSNWQQPPVSPSQQQNPSFRLTYEQMMATQAQRQQHQLPASTPGDSLVVQQDFSYQLNIPTSDYGSLVNQLTQATKSGDVEAQKTLRSQMIEALNGGR